MYRSHVLVCGGTGCTSSGSETLISLLQEELKKNGLENEVAIVKTGCHGLCAQGPVMVIYPDATFYSMVKPEDIPEIVSEHLLKGRVVTRLLYVEDGGKAKALKDTDFYRLQHRVALRNCGIINPESIDEYIGTGGYEALGRVPCHAPLHTIIQHVRPAPFGTCQNAFLVQRSETVLLQNLLRKPAFHYRTTSGHTYYANRHVQTLAQSLCEEKGYGAHLR